MNGRRSAKRLLFTAVLTAVAAAILYYGAVWLLIGRVATMPDSSPPAVRPIR